MNRVTLIGRLTKDPEVRYTSAAEPLAICQFSLAVERPYNKNRAEGESNADFFRCICFGKRGEAVGKYFRKGSKIGIAGRIQTGSYTDQQGNKRYTTDIIAEDFEFCDSKGAQDNPAETDNNYFTEDNTDYGDLPFDVN